jgi:drug/metabolite transporter (DMT)-like permease
MIRLVGLGLTAALCFSSTFILNKAMNLNGGHWVWTGTLRFAWMILFLSVWLVLRSGPKVLIHIWHIFFRHWCFWIIVGSVGVGLFYAPLCFSAVYVKGWITAAAWQSTVVIAPLVLMCFGKKIPSRGLLFSLAIFVGILFVSLEQASSVNSTQVLLGIVPILIAAVSYPLGNQLVKEAKDHGRRYIPHISNPVLQSSSAQVLLMSLGSVPFWGLLTLVCNPSAPTFPQYATTALVALLSGVLGTSIFFFARQNLAKSTYEVAAVEATQAGETVFTLLAEILFLSGSWPHIIGGFGLLLILAGIILYIFYKEGGDSQ